MAAVCTGSVIQLKSESEFRATVLQSGALLVQIYAEWCEHSLNMQNIFKQLASENYDVKFAQIEGPQSPSLAEELASDGFPTVLLYRDGLLLGEFVDAPEIEKVREFISIKLLVHVLSTKESLESLENYQGVTVVGYFATENDVVKTVFQEAVRAVAVQNINDRLAFFELADEKLALARGFLYSPVIELTIPKDEEQEGTHGAKSKMRFDFFTGLDGTITAEAVKTWINRRGFRDPNSPRHSVSDHAPMWAVKQKLEAIVHWVPLSQIEGEVLEAASDDDLEDSIGHRDREL